MYVGEDVNGMAGLGRDGQIGRSINDFADALKRGVNRDSGSGFDSYTSFLDREFSVKQLLLGGVVGYVAYRVLRGWRGRP